jgi:hypothetical protein
MAKISEVFQCPSACFTNGNFTDCDSDSALALHIPLQERLVSILHEVRSEIKAIPKDAVTRVATAALTAGLGSLAFWGMGILTQQEAKSADVEGEIVLLAFLLGGLVAACLSLIRLPVESRLHGMLMGLGLVLGRESVMPRYGYQPHALFALFSSLSGFLSIVPPSRSVLSGEFKSWVVTLVTVNTGYMLGVALIEPDFLKRGMGLAVQGNIVLGTGVGITTGVAFAKKLSAARVSPVRTATSAVVIGIATAVLATFGAFAVDAIIGTMAKVAINVAGLWGGIGLVTATWSAVSGFLERRVIEHV